MSLRDLAHQLAAVPLIERVGEDGRQLLAFSAQRLNLRDGEVLFREGDEARGGHVVLSGMVRMRQAAGLAEQDFGAGSLLGEVALISETRCQATATAVGSTEVLVIERALFRRVLEEFPQAAHGVREAIRSRVQDMTGDLRAASQMFRE